MARELQTDTPFQQVVDSARRIEGALGSSSQPAQSAHQITQGAPDGQPPIPPAKAARGRGHSRGRGRGRGAARTAPGGVPADPPISPDQDRIPVVDAPAQAVSIPATTAISQVGGGHRGASFGHGSDSYQQGRLSLGALPKQSSSRAPSGQGSPMPGPSTSYPGAQGSIQSPAPAPGSLGGSAPQRSQSVSSAPAPPPPAQPARGGAQYCLSLP
uniref:Mucin-1-like n=1 Tax=Nicotiana tabacum TaxID=4097 RepID=A0A1S4A6L6_TOBAC|nr:PREDICTED: mucin-1-like [Nicotiana tabacum]